MLYWTTVVSDDDAKLEELLNSNGITHGRSIGNGPIEIRLDDLNQVIDLAAKEGIVVNRGLF